MDDSSYRTPQRRRRSSGLPSLGTTVVAATALYGAYRLAAALFETGVHDTENDSNRASGNGPTDSVLTSSLRWLTGNDATDQERRRREWRTKRIRFLKCKEEVLSAVQNLFPSVVAIVEKSTATTKATKQLKRIRAHNDDPNKELQRTLWETVKVDSATRLIATAFAHVCLFLVLTTQIHLFASQRATNDSRGSDRSIDSDPVSHRMLLSETYDVFFDTGIVRLVDTVRRAVSRHFADWDVLDPSTMHITQRDLRKVIRAVVHEVLFGAYVKKNKAGMGRYKVRSPTRLFLSHDAVASIDAVSDNSVINAREILNETWDILESPVAEDAFQDCMDVSVGFLFDKLSQLCKTSRTTGTTQSNGDSDCIDNDTGSKTPGVDSHTSPTTPLATVLAQMKTLAKDAYGNKDSLMSLSHQLMQSSSVIELNTVSFD